jgi:hypothetical protein
MFLVFILFQSTGFGQESVRYLDKLFFEIEPNRIAAREYFQVEKKLENKTRTKTFTVDSVLVEDLTEVFDANRNRLFYTRLVYQRGGKLKSKCDFDGRTGVKEWKYFYENGSIRTSQTTRYVEILESVSFDENGKVLSRMLDGIATPKDGNEGWYAYLKANLKYPYMAKKNNEEGIVFLKVYVNAAGKLINAIPFGGEEISDTLIDEAVRAVFAYPDLWNPATFNGEAEGSTFNLPIRFTLSD